MERVPADSAEVVNVAVPPLRAPVPRVEDPFLKVTVPVGVPPVDVTVAVKVTGPSADGFKDEASEVEVAAGGTTKGTLLESVPLGVTTWT